MVRAVFRRRPLARPRARPCTSTCMPGRRPSPRRRSSDPANLPPPQPAVPETALKRRKRDEAWAAALPPPSAALAGRR